MVMFCENSPVKQCFIFWGCHSFWSPCCTLVLQYDSWTPLNETRITKEFLGLNKDSYEVWATSVHLVMVLTIDILIIDTMDHMFYCKNTHQKWLKVCALPDWIVFNFWVILPDFKSWRHTTYIRLWSSIRLNFWWDFWLKPICLNSNRLLQVLFW